MKKGKLKITPKSGYIKIPGGRVALKKEMPHIGEGKEYHNMECEYEGDPATKVIVAGKIFEVDIKSIKAKKKQKEAQKKKKRQKNKLIHMQKQSDDSFELNKTRTPKDTRNCLIDNPDNFSLKLNKFARFDFKDSKRIDKSFTFYNPRPIKDRNKDIVLKKLEIKTDFGNLFTVKNQLSQRLVNSVKQLYQEHSVSTNIFTPSWRLVVGLGGDSVYETGMTLHHIYGVPYIPASSIKGVLRSWVIKSCFDNNENNALEDEMFCCVFGTQKKRGDVTFFDALPTSEPKIEPDIMNPHYPEYYAEKSAPVDTDSPNPIFFLTVKDTSFQFIMVSEEINIENQLLWDDYNLNWWLENALSEHGIGAKTAVGYGYMSLKL